MVGRAGCSSRLLDRTGLDLNGMYNGIPSRPSKFWLLLMMQYI